MTAPRQNEPGLLIGRILLGLLFVIIAAYKLKDMGGLIEWMTSQEMPAPTALAWGTVSIEILGGLCLILGVKVRVAALVLAVYLVPTTFIIHFDLENAGQMTHVYKNLGVIGGLIALWASGGGNRFRLLA